MALFCSKCNRTISPSSMASTIMGNNYHTYCLTCSNCSKPLWNKPFRQTKQGLFCDGDCEAENNVLTNNSSNIVLPTIPGARQPLASTKNNGGLLSGGIRAKHAAKEDNVGALMADPNHIENNNYQGPRAVQPTMQMPPTSTTPPMSSMPQMPLPNEQIQHQRVPHVQPMHPQPVYQYPYNSSSIPNFEAPLTTQRSMNPLYNSQDRQISGISQQNSFLSVNRLNPGQTQRVLYKPYTEYPSYNETPTFEKTFDPANGGPFHCGVCTRLITTNKCTFRDKSYHSECFKCDACNIELFNMKKVLTDPSGQGKFCEPCYSNNFGPRCAKCMEPITPHRLSTGYEDKLYHRECFQCARCKRSLAELEFRKSGNIYICRNCY